MSANIFMNKGFIERSGNKRTPCWHKLGLTVPENEDITCVGMLERAGLDYKVGKFGMIAAIPTKTAYEAFQVPNQVALIRQECKLDPQKRYFGVVTDNYTIIQNRTIAEMLDTFPGHIETCGALGGGEKIFFALTAGGFEIAGDEIKSYFLVTDQKDGMGGLIFCDTDIRVVCQNTLTMGLNSAKNKISLTHGKAVKQEAQEIVNIYNHLQKIKDSNENSLRHILSIKFDTDSAKDMVSRIYPEPEKPKKLQLLDSVDGAKLDTKVLESGRRAYENELDNVQVDRKIVIKCFERFNDQFSLSAATGYALYNSVVEYEDFYKKGKDAQTTAESALFGSRAVVKSRSFDLIAG